MDWFVFILKISCFVTISNAGTSTVVEATISQIALNSNLRSLAVSLFRSLTLKSRQTTELTVIRHRVSFNTFKTAVRIFHFQNWPFICVHLHLSINSICICYYNYLYNYFNFNYFCITYIYTYLLFINTYYLYCNYCSLF